MGRKQELVKSSRLGALTVYVYTFIMVVLFAKEIVYYTNQYRDKQIVKEVSVEERDKALLPPITVCFFLGYNKSMSLLEALQFDSYCKETEDIKDCFEKLMFKREDTVPFILHYPVVDISPENKATKEENFQNVTFNLSSGSCFTYQHREEMELSQENAEMIVFPMSEGAPLSTNWTLAAFLHDKDKFVPSLGISPELMGQQMFLITPESFQVVWISVHVHHRIRRNSSTHQCRDDPDYNIVHCMEESVARAAGCASPWDLHPKDIQECQTREDFRRLFEQQKRIYLNGAPQFISQTGCLPHCEYDEYEVEQYTVKNNIVGNVLGMKFTGVGLSVQSTNVIVRDVLLYGFGSLVGNVGGCLGMFLGVSFVSLYTHTILTVGKATKQM